MQHPEKAQLSQEAYDELAAKQADHADCLLCISPWLKGLWCAAPGEGAAEPGGVR